MAVAAFSRDDIPNPVSSHYFGEFHREPTSEIRLPLGLPGFEDETALVAIEIPEQRPLVYLHSIRNPALCFLSMPVATISEEFALALNEEDRAVLGFQNAEELVQGQNVLALGILFPTEDSLQVNLAAPLIINIGRMVGMQCLMEDSGPIRHLRLDQSGQWVPVC